MNDDQKIPAVIYGVKSTEDEKGAVRDQLNKIREVIDDESRIVGTFHEEDESGFLRSRGPELAAAIQAAIQAADEHGQAELWCWHSSRLARGSGKKDNARALGKRFTTCWKLA